MNIVLWILQVLLAFTFIQVWWLHGFRLKALLRRGIKWVGDVSQGLRRFIGISEILGGIGLILPAITGILTWLTPLAALGLAIIMALAIVFHIRRHEYN